MVYDHLLTFFDEVRVIWTNRLTIASTIFVLNRYISLGGYIVVAYFACGPIGHKVCHIVQHISFNVDPFWLDAP